MKFYDPIKKQLLIVEQKSTPEYWQANWKVNKKNINQIRRKSFAYILLIVKMFLKPGNGIILEGGCGDGKQVSAFKNAGYKCIGIDYDRVTTSILNKYIPELDIRFGDVRHLAFPDNYFIGYCSLGVIEHFIEGYDEIIREGHRVLKKGGYFFVTFPYMSLLRKIKALMGLYQRYTNQSLENFFEFCLNSKLAIQKIEKFGFKYINQFPYDGLKGFKDEISFLSPILNYFYSMPVKSRILKAFRLAISFALSFFAGQITIIIFKKL